MIANLTKKLNFKFRQYQKRSMLKRELKSIKERDEIPLFLIESLDFVVYQHLNQDDKAVVANVEKLRKDILKFKDEVEIIYSPKPGIEQSEDILNVRPKHGEVKTFDAEQIAFKASISQYWGSFLYVLSSRHKSQNMIELGACAGVSGSYLASNPFCKEFITIEGSTQLHTIAEKNIKSVKPDAKIYNGLFDDVLDQILPQLDYKFDFVWIDGHHEKTATLHYFDRLKPHLAKNALVLFDDISWSADMFEAWEEIKNDKGFSLTINLLGQKGLGVWDNSSNFQRRIDFGVDKNSQISKPHGW